MAQRTRKVGDSTGRRRGGRRIQPFAWLGASAMTLGLGAAMASGTAIAHADDASNSGASGIGHSRSADTDSASSPRSARAAKRPAAATAAAPVAGKRTLSLRTPQLRSTSDNGSDTGAPTATAASARQSVARTVAVSVPTAAVSTASSAGSASVTQHSTAAALPPLPPDATPPFGPYAPSTPTVPPYAHVQQAYSDIATAQSALNAATWGTGNILGGLAAVAPQVLLSAASFELSAWEGSNPGAQGFFANTAGIPIIHQIAQVTLVGTMLLPATSQFSLNVANFLLPVVGLFGASIAPAQTALSGAQSNGQVYAVVPVRMYNTTEPLVNVAVNGGSSVPVLVDTGSSGLVIDAKNAGNLDPNNKIATNQSGAYSGGFKYTYDTYKNTTVDFGNGVVSDPDTTTVNVVTSATYGGNPSTLEEYLRGAGAVGVLGIGANTYGPGPSIPTTSLPGELSDGVLLYQNFWPFGLGGFMVFGPNALPARATLTGTPITPLQVSINGGTKKDVMALVDSGGVYGTMPSDIVTPDGSYVPAGTNIAVYAPDGTFLYSFTTGSAPYAPSSVGPSTTDYMNTGYYAYQQGPVYIDYTGNNGSGYTVFDYS
ncbi:PecA family PE domain-processing aspartic protease [Candidatus Mycolicibacterium alkanivorans]|uniref:PecA family PE domain-processing aspartic protease n=1 Tax=Candidatus Mycolicibacterium alkanivorans TaxID=2954114 RepID=A0ABS9YSX5_9MYCO|nr:PecA family PE domain-processing aspartic protease [Candidatus Mycolicibacterium alkanivorans]MCI4674326.1 PecA family PE domain-processing aspartic protease [Candidatus Mycolicibacterium alkanivorans]